MLFRLSAWGRALFTDLFLPPEQGNNRRLILVWLIGLYLGGIALWGIFYDQGYFPIAFHDWATIAAPRLLFLKDAVTRGIFPLHITDPSALGGVTDRYLAVPNTLLSPQILLLRFLDIGQFALVNQLLLYSAGFLGCIWFSRKFSLSPLAFTALFLLFNFNGHIVSHLSVGHFAWGGYFLLPWFAALVFQLLEGDRSWRWVGKMALLMLAIFLQGAFHHFIWLLIFLGLLGLTSWKFLPQVLKAGAFTVLVSLFRVLPASLLKQQFTETYQFMGGYQSVSEIWKSLTVIQLPGTYVDPYSGGIQIGVWEFDLYVGLLGTGFLLFFGLYAWLRSRDRRPYRELLLPMIGMTFLSLGDMFGALQQGPVPLFNGERVSARMISVPFVFLVVLAAIEFQRWLNRTGLRFPYRVALAGVFAAGGHDLWQHFRVWVIARTAPTFDFEPVLSWTWAAANHPDPAYTQALTIGITGSALALGLLFFLIWNGNRRAAGALVFAARGGRGAHRLGGRLVRTFSEFEETRWKVGWKPGLVPQRDESSEEMPDSRRREKG